MSDRGKIRARRVSGNCAQHQRDVAVAIKTARELALLPYTQRTTSDRPGGRGPGRPRSGGPSQGYQAAEAVAEAVAEEVAAEIEELDDELVSIVAGDDESEGEEE